MMRTVIVVAFLLAGCGAPPRPSVGAIPGPVAADMVRVALKFAEPEVTFAAARGARWTTGEDEGWVGAGRCVVRERDGSMELWHDGRTTVLGEGPIRFMGPGEWAIDGDRFSGDLVVQRATWGGTTLVNLVELEEYLRGVVPWEIGRPGEDALEAVKAQAIAARTYTIGHLGRWEELGFDVYGDVRDQVYRGRTGTAPITDRAVRETRGRILIHAGVPVRAYYSSTCGGHTSTLTDVWDREGASYLQGFRDVDENGASWCRDGAQFRWTEAWSARELGEVLREHLGAQLGLELDREEFGVFRGLEVLERDPSGRVSRLRVLTDGDEYEVWGDRIRWVLRPVHSRFAILRSTLFTVDQDVVDGRVRRVVLRGGGFGHGVGMCQTGALARAKAGQSAGEILEAYYPGAHVGPLEGARTASFGGGGVLRIPLRRV